MLSSLIFINGLLPIGVRFNSPLWSLPYEVWYYIIVGLIATMRPFLIAISLIMFILICSSNDRFLAYSLVWFSGFSVSYFRRENKILNTLSIVTALYFGFQSIISASQFLNNKLPLENFKVYFGITFSLLIYIFLIVLKIRFSVLKSSSRFAYSLYILHFPVMLFFIGVFETSVINDPSKSALIGCAAMITSLTIAFFSSRIFENKRLMNQFLYISISDLLKPLKIRWEQFKNSGNTLK